MKQPSTDIENLNGSRRERLLRVAVYQAISGIKCAEGLLFATHAVITSHYFNGAWYPDGGAGEIAKATGAVIRAAGGELLPNHEVTRILLEGGRAVGVEVNISKGKQGARAEFRAPVIVSDAGAWNTFTRMLPASALPFHDQLKSPPEGFEVVELFLGLRRDPREMGFKGENYWIFESFDHDETYAQRNAVLDGRAAMAYLSFPSLKDTRAQPHTAEIIAPLSYGSLEAHRNEPWRRRSADYESAKNRITRALLDLVERHHPGFGDLVQLLDRQECFLVGVEKSFHAFANMRQFPLQTLLTFLGRIARERCRVPFCSSSSRRCSTAGKKSFSRTASRRLPGEGTTHL